MRRSRKLIISVLIVLTISLAGISAYVAYRLQQESAPDDTSASTCASMYIENNCIVVPPECPPVDAWKFSQQVGNDEPDWCGTSDNQEPFTLSPGNRYCPEFEGQCGYCVQIDDQAGTIGVAGYTGVCDDGGSDEYPIEVKGEVYCKEGSNTYPMPGITVRGTKENPVVQENPRASSVTGNGGRFTLNFDDLRWGGWFDIEVEDVPDNLTLSTGQPYSELVMSNTFCDDVNQTECEQKDDPSLEPLVCSVNSSGYEYYDHCRIRRGESVGNFIFEFSNCSPSQNTCEAAGLDYPAQGQTAQVQPGQNVTITGWAADADGIDRVEISTDNGDLANVEANLRNIDCSDTNDPRYDVCQNGYTNNPVEYSLAYTIPALTAGATVSVTAVVYDGQGNTGGNCNFTGTFSVGSGLPVCGDGICNASGENCERTASGANTYAACTTQDLAAQRAPNGAAVADCRGVSFNQSVTGTTCKYCGDGEVQSPEQCEPSVHPNCNNDCTWQDVQNQCLDLTESADPIRSGTGNVVVYQLEYQHNSTTNPFPNIRLRVGPSGSPVGRDLNNPTSSLVAPVFAPVHDPVNSTYRWVFVWEAASPGGTPVTAGTYAVTVLLDGASQEVTSPASCTETITVDDSSQQEPVFVINKTSTEQCNLSTGASEITYTITLTNVGPVSGTIDYLEDTYDANLYSLGITPININPAAESVTGNVIRWGPATFNAGESRNYSYQVIIPESDLINFVYNGVLNQAEAQYDTPGSQDNTVSFDLRTLITCSVPSTPNTAIGDGWRFFLIGLSLVFAALIAYRFRLGRNFVVWNIFGRFSSSFIDRVFEEDVEEDLRSKK